MNPLIIILFCLWELYWKYHALWLAAQKKEKRYFLAILIINSIGILPIYYLYKNNYFYRTNVEEK